jgi:Tfp pilus assembly protein PilO
MKGLTPVILIALSLGLFFYFIQPQYEGIKVLQAEKERYDEAVDAAQELQALRDDLVNQYNSFSTADLRRIAKFLPEQVDDVRLVLDIDRIAQESSINIEEILVLENLADTQSGRNSGNRTSLSEQIEVETETLALQLTFDASYGEFLDFITDLETSLRIVDITELSFSSEDTEAPGIYTFNITLQTYWLK